MQRQQFSYQLPKHLIASQPTVERSGSRLLVLESGAGGVSHRHFTDLPNYLQAGDLLIFNDTKVIPARLHGHKATGGKVEILIERLQADNLALAQVRASKPLRPGGVIELANKREISVVGREGEFYQLNFGDDVLALLQELGEMPLPPYMERPANAFDGERYQTVYAKQPGAIAAPTAGLHFDQAMLQDLSERGVDSVFLTLHVGAGTFQPVRVEDISTHQMHREWMELSQAVCDKVTACRQAGGRVIAVGTTSVRALESASVSGELQATRGETQIFIYPPYQFQVVDAMITNFHLPESTLLMLVCAFAGIEPTLNAYRQAVEEQYRFFSYGDAMFVTRKNTCV